MRQESASLTEEEHFGNRQAASSCVIKETGEEEVPGSSLEEVSEEDQAPPPPRKDTPDHTSSISRIDGDLYSNPLRSSRTNSLYSYSRASFSNQLSQLTSLNLPNASSLSSNISCILTAPHAAKALSRAAGQIHKWIYKASEVLSGLNAEDDVEWAAAGGREGLGEVDTAIGKFEGLIKTYVSAIEKLQLRPDVSKVPVEGLKAIVHQMEKTLKEWDNVRSLLRGVKEQVELAMEWEELWNVVLGDIGLEVENQVKLVFEMEERRHAAVTEESDIEDEMGLDLSELETIVEESPMSGNYSSGNRFSLPPSFPASSQATSNAQEEASLLALFARMQPLRASLDFLPMRLSSFQSRAEANFPTACRELEDRRKSMERNWWQLERDAENLRRELSEDRWVLVFRNSARKAQKLCESFEHGMAKLQESIDLGHQHNNPPALHQRVENYESKRTHYGQAIQRLMAIIEQGISERKIINGEILRLHVDLQARWATIEIESKNMDFILDDLTVKKNHQLRDSISTIISMDRSATGSLAETPRSSPASSVAMGPSNGKKGDALATLMNGASRRSSAVSSITSRPATSRRYVSMPQDPADGSQLPRIPGVSRSFSFNPLSTSRAASPTPNSRYMSSTPTPGGRQQRPTLIPLDGKPRWNSSPKVEYTDKPIPYITPPPCRKSPMSFRTPNSPISQSYNFPKPSPLGRDSSFPQAPHSAPLPHSRLSSSTHSPLAFRENSSSPAPPSPALPRPRMYSGTQSSLAVRPPRISSSPARSSQANTEHPRSRLKTQISVSSLPISARRQSVMLESAIEAEKQPLTKFDKQDLQLVESPSARSKPQRPATALANGRRSSMLPQRKVTATNGRDSAAGNRNGR